MAKKRYVYVEVCWWRWTETKRLQVGDVFEAVCSVCPVSRWVAGGLFKSTAGTV